MLCLEYCFFLRLEPSSPPPSILLTVPSACAASLQRLWSGRPSMDVRTGRRGKGITTLRAGVWAVVSAFHNVEDFSHLWHAGPDESFRARHIHQRPLCGHGRAFDGRLGLGCKLPARMAASLLEVLTWPYVLLQVVRKRLNKPMTLAEKVGLSAMQIHFTVGCELGIFPHDIDYLRRLSMVILMTLKVRISRGASATSNYGQVMSSCSKNRRCFSFFPHSWKHADRM